MTKIILVKGDLQGPESYEQLAESYGELMEIVDELKENEYQLKDKSERM